MISLVTRFDHAFAPGGSPEASQRLAEILMRPCFDLADRVSVMRGDRQTAYKPKRAASIVEYLADPQNDSVILDNGRKGELVAKVRLETGLTGRALVTNRPAPLISYAVIPLEGVNYSPIIDSCCDMAVALKTINGVVTAEKSFGKAQGFALSIKSDYSEELAAGKTTEARLKERAAHYYFSGEIDEKLAAPEWGLFLSAKHLQHLSLRVLKEAFPFSIIRVLSEGQLVYLQMTDNPRDALAPEFNALLAKAREALRSLLIDVGHLPDYAWR
jgi:hypothetical protein